MPQVPRPPWRRDRGYHEPFSAGRPFFEPGSSRFKPREMFNFTRPRPSEMFEDLRTKRTECSRILFQKAEQRPRESPETRVKVRGICHISGQKFASNFTFGRRRGVKPHFAALKRGSGAIFCAILRADALSSTVPANSPTAPCYLPGQEWQIDRNAIPRGDKA